jgi:hypothetical protein
MKVASLIFTVVIFVTFQANADEKLIIPKKNDADVWLSNFQQLQENVSDSSIIKDRIKLQAQRPLIEKSRDIAEKLFGDFSECHKSTLSLLSSLSELERLVFVPHSNPELTVAVLAKILWTGGQRYAECNNFIDKLTK